MPRNLPISEQSYLIKKLPAEWEFVRKFRIQKVYVRLCREASPIFHDWERPCLDVLGWQRRTQIGTTAVQFPHSVSFNDIIVRHEKRSKTSANQI